MLRLKDTLRKYLRLSWKSFYPHDTSGTGICSDGAISDKKSKDKVILLSGDIDRLQIFIDRLNAFVSV